MHQMSGWDSTQTTDQVSAQTLGLTSITTAQRTVSASTQPASQGNTHYTAERLGQYTG